MAFEKVPESGKKTVETLNKLQSSDQEKINAWLQMGEAMSHPKEKTDDIESYKALDTARLDWWKKMAEGKNTPYPKPNEQPI